jgi:menaquinone-specific isochorismate synthase
VDAQTPLSPSAAAQEIAAQLARWAAGAGEVAPLAPIVRIAFRIEDISPIEWLRAQRHTTQYYWSERDGQFEMAGIGEADVVIPKPGRTLDQLFERMRARLSPRHPSLRYYGGFRFHPGAVKGDRWSAFGDYRFVVPRFEVLRRDGRTYLTCNATVPPKTDASQAFNHFLDLLASIQFPKTPQPIELPRVKSRTDAPDRRGWDDRVNRALEAIRAGKLGKVVLSRESVFKGDAPFDALSVLSALLEYAMRSFEFCFHPAEDRAFIGASPERLYKRNNCHLQSEALAGTRPRGQTDAKDRALADELLSNEKETREHRFVVERLKENFDSLCRHVEVQGHPSIMRQWSCQHLYTRIEGILNADVGDADLISALHPTPALGGAPREAALEWIAREEPFDRGIYGAPVGWVGFDAAEFCVAIRSGLIQGNELALYTGAGIVDGSVPEAEWNEIDTKMEGFLRVLR